MKKDNGKEIGFLENFCYGIGMGIFEVVPGISGGTLALILGIYETLIEAISNIRKNFKENIKILFPTLAGMGAGVYCFSFIISFLNKNYPMEVNFGLTGLIIGVVPYIFSKAYNSLNDYEISNENESNYKNKKGSFKFLFCFLSLILTLAVMFIINYYSFNSPLSGEIIKNIGFFEGIKFSVIAMLASFCLMLPGCSGSLVMLVFGIYYSVIESIHNFDFSIIIPVGIGIIIGLIFGAKIISFCLNNFKAQTFFAILGLIIGSSVAPFLNFLKSCNNILDLKYIIFHGVISVICLAFGYIFSFYFSSPKK